MPPLQFSNARVSYAWHDSDDLIALVSIADKCTDARVTLRFTDAVFIEKRGTSYVSAPVSQLFDRDFSISLDKTTINIVLRLTREDGVEFCVIAEAYQDITPRAFNPGSVDIEVSVSECYQQITYTSGRIVLAPQSG